MFMPYKNNDGARDPYEYLPCSGITPKLGMAMVPNASGQLAIATGTNAPTYISVFDSENAVAAGTIIPVVRVNKRTIYKTTLSASGSNLKIGNKVTLHTSNGMQVTATTTDGVAEIVDIIDSANGGEVLVRF